MFNKSDIAVANKTSRGKGAIGSNAIVPQLVRDRMGKYHDKNMTMLDFGAGKNAVHTQALLADGFNCTAYEFGDNINPEIHDADALKRKYSVVFASNVLNVQSSVEMARDTIKQAADAVEQYGHFFANYPASPRKSKITIKEMEALLCEQFVIVQRVKHSTALWICVKDSTAGWIG